MAFYNPATGKEEHNFCVVGVSSCKYCPYRENGECPLDGKTTEEQNAFLAEKKIEEEINKALEEDI